MWVEGSGSAVSLAWICEGFELGHFPDQSRGVIGLACDFGMSSEDVYRLWGLADLVRVGDQDARQT